MWQEGYKERYEQRRKLMQALARIDELEEKAKKYDELQGHWWWLERRTHDGKTANVNIKTFLNGIKKYFEPYKEDEK